MKTQIINATYLLADGLFSSTQDKLNQNIYTVFRAYLTNLLFLVTFQ